jgi:hypothetical protein
VGVSKVGGIFVHKSQIGRVDEKATSLRRETAMQEALRPEQEAQAQQLAERIRAAADAEILQMARVIVAAGSSPFGAAEFDIRDHALGIGAQAIEQALAQKKTATTARG